MTDRDRATRGVLDDLLTRIGARCGRDPRAKWRQLPEQLRAVVAAGEGALTPVQASRSAQMRPAQAETERQERRSMTDAALQTPWGLRI